MGLVQFSFKSHQRIRKSSEFENVYKQGKRNASGPLLIYSIYNELEFSRLGLSIPKHVGNSVKRNTIKRRCREAFRLRCDALPEGIDIVINVRPHELLSMEEYAAYIMNGLGR